MLIKLYCSDNTLVIIENIKDVRVHLDVYSFVYKEDLKSSDFGPNPYIIPTYIDDPNSKAIVGEPTNCRIIDYVDKDDVWHRLIVDCWAYICNDQGRTVEKVDIGSGIR